MVAMQIATGCVSGFTPDALNGMWADHIVDHNRHECDVDRILSRYEDTPALYPDSATLEGLNLDVRLIAICLHTNKLTPEKVGELVANVIAGELSVEDANSGLANTAETDEAARLHPEDLLTQAMHRAGCCDECHADFDVHCN